MDYGRFERLAKEIEQEEEQEYQVLYEKHKDDDVYVNVKDLPPSET